MTLVTLTVIIIIIIITIIISLLIYKAKGHEEDTTRYSFQRTMAARVHKRDDALSSRRISVLVI